MPRAHPHGRPQRRPVGRIGVTLMALAIATAGLTGLGGAADAEVPETPAPVAGESAALTLPASKFVALTPTRVLDTRADRAPDRGIPRLGPRTALSIDPIGGSAVETQLGDLGVGRSEVTAVVANITLVNAGAPGFATLWPTGFERPTASTNNGLFDGHTTPNLVITPLGLDGKISIFSLADADYIVDVMGVMVETVGSTDGRFVSLGPVRHSDTRSPDLHTPGQQRYTDGESRIVDLTPVGVPDTASAVVLNVTAVRPERPGFVRVWPAGQRPVPAHSNVNVPVPGQATSNQVVTGVEAGRIEVFSLAATDLVIDVSGYFTGSTDPSGTDGLFVPITPGRLLDTRNATGTTALTGGEPVPANQAIRVPIVDRLDIPATGVKAAAFNLTAVRPAAAGFLTAFPSAAQRPATSSVNYNEPNVVVPNHAITSLSANGSIDVFTLAESHVVLDVSGYFLDETGTPPAGSRPTKVLEPGTFAPDRLPGALRPASGPYDFLFERSAFATFGNRMDTSQTFPARPLKVAWNACAPIRYALNVDLADDAQIEVLISSIEEIERATGIDLQFGGVTSAGLNVSDDVLLSDSFGLPFQYLPPDDDGGGPVDVVIGFSDAANTPELGGGVIGVGGSLRTEFDSSGRADAARGFAIIDLADLEDGGSAVEIEELTATTTHELGHMMGLGHVSDGDRPPPFQRVDGFPFPDSQGLETPGAFSFDTVRSQLMYPSLSLFDTGTTFNEGDELGFWELYNDTEQDCSTSLRRSDPAPLVAVARILDEHHDAHDAHDAHQGEDHHEDEDAHHHDG